MAADGYDARSRPVTMEDVTTAIVLTLALVGLGIVVDQLFRLKKWLKRPPAGGAGSDPPDRPA